MVKDVLYNTKELVEIVDSYEYLVENLHTHSSSPDFTKTIKEVYTSDPQRNGSILLTLTFTNEEFNLFNEDFLKNHFDLKEVDYKTLKLQPITYGTDNIRFIPKENPMKLTVDGIRYTDLSQYIPKNIFTDEKVALENGFKPIDIRPGESYTANEVAYADIIENLGWLYTDSETNNKVITFLFYPLGNKGIDFRKFHQISWSLESEWTNTVNNTFGDEFTFIQNESLNKNINLTINRRKSDKKSGVGKNSNGPVWFSFDLFEANLSNMGDLISWSDIPTEYLFYWKTLGFNETNWNNKILPEIIKKEWDNLDKSPKFAAEMLRFNKDSWNNNNFYSLGHNVFKNLIPVIIDVAETASTNVFTIRDKYNKQIGFYNNGIYNAYLPLGTLSLIVTDSDSGKITIRGIEGTVYVDSFTPGNSSTVEKKTPIQLKFSVFEPQITNNYIDVNIYCTGSKTPWDITWEIMKDQEIILSGVGNKTISARLPTGSLTLIGRDSLGDGWKSAKIDIVGLDGTTYLSNWKLPSVYTAYGQNSFKKYESFMIPELKLSSLKTDIINLQKNTQQLSIKNKQLNQKLNQIVYFRIKLDELIKSIYNEKEIKVENGSSIKDTEWSLSTITTSLQKDSITEGEILHFKNFKNEINEVYKLAKTELNKLI